MVTEVRLVVVSGVQGTGREGNEEFLGYWVVVPWLYMYVKLIELYTND